MLLLIRAMNLWKITCTPSFCSCDKRSFQTFSISCLLFNSQIFFCFSSHQRYAFFFSPFTSVICLSMNSWRRQFVISMSNTIGFLLRNVLFSLVTFSGHCIVSILLQHHISKFSKYFSCNLLKDQVSKPDWKKNSKWLNSGTCNSVYDSGSIPAKGRIFGPCIGANVASLEMY